MMPTSHPVSGIRDNHGRGTAGEYIAEILATNSKVSVVSAYFTIQAYAQLSRALEQIDHLRFLFGEPQGTTNADTDKMAAHEFRLTEQGLDVANQLTQSKLARDCANWIKQKVDIRSVNQAGLLHGKMYHIQNGDGGPSHALLGSSNFTLSGLGLHATPERNNVELNLVVDSNRDRNDLLAWFDEWWRDDSRTSDIKERVLKELANLYINHPPNFIYYLTLFHIFREHLASENDVTTDLERVNFYDTAIWKMLFNFQKAGAKAVINKINTFGGCILADSVGLGKTFTALAAIKYFQLKNNRRTLVLCPKKLCPNWTLYHMNSSLNPLIEDKFNYDVLSHTDLSRTGGFTGGIDLGHVEWSNYDLVVIDESHNFRNNNKAKPNQTNEPTKPTRYEKLINDVIKQGSETKILLLSATPVNNDLRDLRNQISFIAGGDVTQDTAADTCFHSGSREKLGITSIKSTTNRAQAKFNEWSKNSSGERSGATLLEMLDGDFFKLLDGLSIARSRKQIKQYYQEELSRIGQFPHREKPRSRYPQIDSESNYSFEQLNNEIDKLNLALYQPTSYLRDDLDDGIKKTYIDKVGGFTQKGRERILIAMMKINFLKRLESSVDSFRQTIDRTIQKIDCLEEKFVAFEINQTTAEIDYNETLPEDLDDPEIEDREFIIGGKRKFHLGHINIPKWREKIQKDHTQLQKLLDGVQPITIARDAKLAHLREEITTKLTHPYLTNDGRENRKILIFTAYADTARYLHKNLSQHIVDSGAHVALVCGDGGNATTLGKKDYNHILTNFSPLSKMRQQQRCFNAEESSNQQIDVLIATDCISEGQNLQDCDLLINYDIHWNPVRIIQRFGRIDRIGSKNKSVHLVNFWPTTDLDRYLNLKNRVEARMALVDISTTQTDNLLTDLQLTDLVSKDLQFRDQQLIRLKDEVLDLEDMDGHSNLTDFSLDDFRQDLSQFLAARQTELEKANLGLYAVVPSTSTNSIVQPGVIFCLRHRSTDKPIDSANKINPLGQYYLVYVLDDGQVLLSYAQPKQILTLLRDLAAGQTHAIAALCDLFDSRTKNGADMKHYNDLVKEALASIERTFAARAQNILRSSRNAMLPTIGQTPSTNASDYELITWFVILDPAHAT